MATPRTSPSHCPVPCAGCPRASRQHCRSNAKIADCDAGLLFQRERDQQPSQARDITNLLRAERVTGSVGPTSSVSNLGYLTCRPSSDLPLSPCLSLRPLLPLPAASTPRSFVPTAGPFAILSGSHMAGPAVTRWGVRLELKHATQHTAENHMRPIKSAFIILALMAGAMAPAIAQSAQSAQSSQVTDAGGDFQGIAQALRAGGYIILLRHGATFSNQADIDPFNLADTTKQRNLNDEGKQLAKAFGAAIRAARVPVGEVY